MSGVWKPWIRLLAFFFKELNEVRRQPRLVASLILGPLLILALFGLGYRGERPALVTALVLPPGQLDEAEVERLRSSLEPEFTLESVDADETRAMARLIAGRVDVVEIFPDQIQQTVTSGQRAAVRFVYNEVDPVNEQWIRYLSYVQVNEINRLILLDAAERAREEAVETQERLGQARSSLDQLEGGSPDEQQAARRDLRGLGEALIALALAPTLAGPLGEGDTTRDELDALREDLRLLEDASAAGQLDQEAGRIERVRQRMDRIDVLLDQFLAIPPEVLVSPLQQETENLRGESLSFMAYYAPAVVALILQHIAVSLGALSLVRERLVGALEYFGVAPVSMLEVLVGKYLAYTLFIMVLAVALLLLVPLLEVPMLADPLPTAGFLLLFAVASLGLGFVISAISSSDTQAVQLSMLVLLLSIFFSGFVLPLENFWDAMRAVSFLIPLTYGVMGLQQAMLQGINPGTITWAGLAVISMVTFALAAVIWRRQFGKVA